MPRCDLCFKEKSPLQPVLPKCEARVCKGCYYDIDRIIGFLEHYKVKVMSYQPELSPPKPPKTSKPTKSKSEGLLTGLDDKSHAES